MHYETWKIIEKKLDHVAAHLQAVMSSACYRRRDMTLWCHVTSSCKYKNSNIFELSNPNYLRNKKGNTHLAHMQAYMSEIITIIIIIIIITNFAPK